MARACILLFRPDAQLVAGSFLYVPSAHLVSLFSSSERLAFSCSHRSMVVYCCSGCYCLTGIPVQPPLLSELCSLLSIQYIFVLLSPSVEPAKLVPGFPAPFELGGLKEIRSSW